MASYFVCSAATGTNSGASWLNAHVSIPGCMTAQALVGGDIIYVHVTHNYVASATITWTLPESGTGLVKVICVDGGDAAFTALGAAMGSTVGSIASGATENTNGNFQFKVYTVSSTGASLYVFGMIIKAGAGGNTSSSDVLLNDQNHGEMTFEMCSFWTHSTNSGAQIIVGSASSIYTRHIFRNCSFRFGSTSGAISAAGGEIEMYNCSIVSAGSSPTTLFIVASATARLTLYCSGCDWSLATNVVDRSVPGPWAVKMNNCTINTPVTGTISGVLGPICEFQACAAVDGTNGPDMLAYYKDDLRGTVEDDQTVYLTSGGAEGTQDDGTVTPFSLKMTPTALASAATPLYSPWIYKKISSTGSKTVSIEVADTESAVLKDSTLWIEVQYVGGGGLDNSPQSQLEGSFPLLGIVHDVTAAGSNLTDTGVAWTGVAETDTYTLSKTVTLDAQGYIRARVGLGIQTTSPVYVDQLLTVT